MSTIVKRTRKPKVESAESAITALNTTTAAPEVKKGRAKKTPAIVAHVGPSGISGSFLPEQRPLIAHIPITSVNLEFENTNLIKFEPSEESQGPKAYDSPGAEVMSYLDGIKEGEGAENEIIQEVVETKPTCKLPTNYSEKLMVLFQDANRYQKLPEKTDTACFWCAHGFSTPPFAIPSHILDEVYYMYGCFCSAECATAYLFKERIDTSVQWERYALLNSLYADDAEIPHGSNAGIRPAPPRETLRMFGGSMDISEYRALVHEKKLRVDVLTPPMVSIIQTMDTKPVDFYDQNLKNVFIKNDITHKYNAPGAQGLRLRRSKPVKSKESTVEWAMQIQMLSA